MPTPDETTAEILRFPSKSPGPDKSRVEIIENGNTVIAMATNMTLPDALRWAADVMDGKAKEPVA